MNYENKNVSEINDITKNINQNCCRKECNDTGNQWTKNCPKCNGIQIYKSKRSFWNARRNKSICTSCKNSGVNNPFYGKKHTKKHKKKLSTTQLKNGSFRYKNKGGNPPKINKKCKYCNLSFKTVLSVKSVYCCYKCALKDNFGFNGTKKTKPELEIETYLKNSDITYEYNYELCGKLYDFYIPSLNLLIEVDGIYWHGKDKKEIELNETQLKNRKNDGVKTRLAKKYGYNLIRIWEDEVKDVSKYIRR